MESDTLEEILQNSEINNVHLTNHSTSNLTNDLTTFNKQSPNDNDLYNVDSDNLEFILNQEYEFNSDSKESNDCNEIFQIVDDDEVSEIIQLDSELSNMDKFEKNESNLDNDVLFLENTNATETINEVINNLIDQVDQKLPASDSNAGNVSKITIQKRTDVEPAIFDKTPTDNQKVEKNKSINSEEKIISNFKSLNNRKKSIDLVPCLDSVKRLRPNILKKSRLSLPSNQKFKSMHISEILKLYGQPDPVAVVKQENVQSEIGSSAAFKTRIKQKVNIVVEKKTHLELIREYFDSNNNLIRQEKIEEKDHKDIIQTISKEKVLPNKSVRLDSIDDLSSSSSTNLNYLSNLKAKRNDDTIKKTYKLALSNRYRNQSPETPKKAKKRPIRVKNQLSKKSGPRSPPKTNNFSFSNIRFNLTPQERKKDLLVLKNGIECEKDTSSPSRENLLDDTLVNKNIEKFLVEFGNEVQQMTTKNNKIKTKTCHVTLERMPDSDFEYYFEKFRNDLKKPKNKFKLGDKVFIKENGYYLPAVVTDIQSKCRLQSSSFFNTSSSDIYYSYGCCLAFKSENYRSSNQIIYEKENMIIKHNWLKPNDLIMVYNLKNSRYANGEVIAHTSEKNKETAISDLLVKLYRSRFKKLVPFQLVAISHDQAEKIFKRNSNQVEKTPAKKFSYVNRVADNVFSESECSLLSDRKKSDSDYNIEPEPEESEDNENESLADLKKRRKTSLGAKRPRLSLKTALKLDLNQEVRQIEIGKDSPIKDSFKNGSLSNTSIASNNSLNLTICRAANFVNSDSQRKTRSSFFSYKNKTN